MRYVVLVMILGLSGCYNWVVDQSIEPSNLNSESQEEMAGDDETMTDQENVLDQSDAELDNSIDLNVGRDMGMITNEMTEDAGRLEAGDEVAGTEVAGTEVAGTEDEVEGSMEEPMDMIAGEEGGMSSGGEAGSSGGDSVEAGEMGGMMTTDSQGTCEEPLQLFPNQEVTINTCDFADQISVCQSSGQPDLTFIVTSREDCALQFGDQINIRLRNGLFCFAEPSENCIGSVSEIGQADSGNPFVFTAERDGACGSITISYPCSN